ncbi:hypothetical protein P152DRAFT_396283 [Eremomyces bilateralis CBS 781.70]|uniref:Heavy metal tolerance protein n=1 Tax=Eremomyces bilateralis CBS 781.70 TaxID=1392243 RepID=A0A6G1G3Y0_9PEZI|nr:uncharacterized protein P152DRAFT_396283 [Eremomyces bilateralis CBS 781.70]KAF1812774.1 hypothetical protein P152DRAFT_396283 [Eremomyces bilateralis CBS 781.70]
MLGKDVSAITALEALSYAQGIVLAVWFGASTAYAASQFHTSTKVKYIKRQRIVAVILMSFLLLGYLGEGILYVVRIARNPNWELQEENVVRVVLACCVWGMVEVIALDVVDVFWMPYLGGWILGLIFEVVLLILSATGNTRTNIYDDARLGLQAGRVILLSMLVINGIFLVGKYTHGPSTEEERQPLIVVEDSNYDSDGESIHKGDKTKADISKKIKEDGWYAYAKRFSVFIPYVFPVKERRIMVFLVLRGILTVVDLLIDLLIPLQLGILTNKLTEVTGTGVVPWKDISIWMGLQFLRGPLFIQMAQQLLLTVVSIWQSVALKTFTFNHIMSLSMEFHNDKASGEVTQAISQGEALTNLLEDVCFELMPLIFHVFLTVSFVSYLFDVNLALVLLVSSVSYTWCVARSTKAFRPIRRKYVELSRNKSNVMYESIGNWQTVTYFNRLSHSMKRFRDCTLEVMELRLKYWILIDIWYGLQQNILQLGLLCACFLAAFKIARGEQSVGSFIALISYWQGLTHPISVLARSYRNVAQYLIDAERLLQLVLTKPAVVDKEEAEELNITDGRVEFKNVSFAYDERKPTLIDVNFTAEPGNTVAFVGETGSGKSTMLKLLFRFYDVKSGGIEIDGQNIKDVTLSSLREHMGVVPQDSTLFNQSIMENVRYARLEATDEEIYEACKAASIHEKILSFPDGYASKVGERGVKLSGGELQRVSIARVLLKNPKIVLLDEATSAVDSETEGQIQDAFSRLSVGRTTFVIAHRLSTIMDANLILVVDKGHIIERGTHDELLAMKGKFFKLWTKQRGFRDSKDSSVTAGGDDLIATDPSQVD